MTASSRPFSGVLIGVFLLASAAGLWKMRIEPALENIPVGFEDVVIKEGRLPNGQPLTSVYTSVAPVDALLQTLVAAFLSGRDEPEVLLQQIYFLGEFLGILTVWNVEAYRERNAWRIISFTGVFALFYQTIGGAAILPLYYVAWVSLSSKDSYLASGRQVPAFEATALLPALTLGYIVPTALAYYPWDALVTLEKATALWQPAPFVPNIIIWAASLVRRPSAGAPSPKDWDVPQLKRIYLFATFICAALHLAIGVAIMTSADPRVSLSSVLLPNWQTYKSDMAHGLHWIFAWDFWFCFLSSLLWLLISVIDVLRVGGELTAIRTAKAALVIGLLSVITGPGAAISIVWFWREGKLVELEHKMRRVTMKAKTG
ncbi:hypothetical protein GQ53DRAFT_845234 [Thozetella sp. PMI_491]|nr:hypothetical protein GQ53DRAFT_845234 [Thozetella sp. PMI_491]